MRVFKHQGDFINSTAKYPALVAGFGSGKTLAFCIKACVQACMNPGKLGLLAEPVYPMVRQILKPTFDFVLGELGFNYRYSATDMRYRIYWEGGWADVILMSAENYEKWRGLNLAWGGLDEADILKDASAWKMLLSRLRDGETLCAFISTTPEGFKWVYEYWVSEKREGYELIQARTEANTTLPAEFIESLKQNYDERLIKAYLGGEFVNLQHGQTYYTFNREKNVKAVSYNERLPIRANIDFNVDPLACTLWQKYDASPRIRVLDCIGLKHSGDDDLITERMAREIKRRYKTRVIAYPDPAGKSRGTSSRRSDHKILRDEGFELRVKNAAPSVVDSVNAVNRMMGDTIIDPKCKDFIIDLEQTINKDGTRDIDKSNKERTHYTDGFRYGIDYEFPVKRPIYGGIPR